MIILTRKVFKKFKAPKNIVLNLSSCLALPPGLKAGIAGVKEFVLIRF
ncbi:MAG: hypothetical protein JST95_12115 [Bacteroidetes bacterium]|nr:hypothetical protein [Bacteroidota bacterium]